MQTYTQYTNICISYTLFISMNRSSLFIVNVKIKWKNCYRNFWDNKCHFFADTHKNHNVCFRMIGGSYKDVCNGILSNVCNNKSQTKTHSHLHGTMSLLYWITAESQQTLTHQNVHITPSSIRAHKTWNQHERQNIRNL